MRASQLLQARSYAEAQAPAAAHLDWEELTSLVTSDEGKRELGALRGAFADITSRLNALTKPVEPINWEAYKGQLDPVLVSEFEKAVKSLKFPKLELPEADEAQKQFDALAVEAEEFVKATEQRVKEIEAELQAIETEKAKIESISIDEELAADPALAKEIDKEIAEGNFLP